MAPQVRSRTFPSEEVAEQRAWDRAAGFLRLHGILPLTSPTGVPSLVTLVAQRAVRGSWWGHPAGSLIYTIGQRLDASERELVSVKLFDRRITWVARSLWPQLLGVAAAREPWQLRGLGRSSTELLNEVDRIGSCSGDATSARFGGPAYDVFRRNAKLLEDRLLVLSGSAHTSSGVHTRNLRSWNAWARPLDVRPSRVDPAQLRSEFEAIGRAFAEDHRVHWPWTDSSLGPNP